MGSGTRPAAEGRILEVNLIEDIDQTLTATPTLWWLGRAGFVVRFANITFTWTRACRGRARCSKAPRSSNADMILATHAHPGHLDAPSVIAMLEGSKGAKLILPKSAADQAHAAGIPYPRMTTTDADLRVEYFKGQPVRTHLRGAFRASTTGSDSARRLPVSGLPDPLRALDHLSRGRLRAATTR